MYSCYIYNWDVQDFCSFFRFRMDDHFVVKYNIINYTLLEANKKAGIVTAKVVI